MTSKTCVALAAICLSACQPGTYHEPWSVTGGFFGATVTVAQPGFTEPARVVQSPVSQPTLIVPPDAPKTSGNVAVKTASGQTASVPVKTGNVEKPILAVSKP